MSKPLNIGMIGYGFMGRALSNAYCKVNHFFDLEYRPVLKTVCARNADNVKAFADNWGYESIETDWRQLVARNDIDAVDICVPNNLHREIAIAAAEAAPKLDVAVVSKVYPMRSHTVSAEGGAAAVIKSDDSLDAHAYDTISGGD